DLVEARLHGAVQLELGMCGHPVILSSAVLDASPGSLLITRRRASDSAAHRTPSSAATAPATTHAGIPPPTAQSTSRAPATASCPYGAAPSNRSENAAVPSR